MSPRRTWRAGLLARWQGTWLDEIPPHSYALLRILLGTMCLANLLALTPVDMFWSIDGLAPVPSSGGVRAWLLAHGLATVSGRVVFVGVLAIFSAMTLGLWSNAAVLAAQVALIGQNIWNHNPLSGAHQALLVLNFCLVWADTGQVWSIDALRRKSQSVDRNAVAAWPLWLMRGQVAVIYVSSGLHKLAYPVWRDGSAVYWALNLNAFHRFPWTIPEGAAPLLAMLSWATMLFELVFPVFVFWKKTRSATLIAGVALHLGLWLALEIGPFSWIMIASYVAFLDPDQTARLWTREFPWLSGRARDERARHANSGLP